MPEVDEEEKASKPGRKEFREDVSEAVSSAMKKGRKKLKKVLKKVKGKGKGKYADFSSKELYQLVKQKRDQLLAKKGMPAKIPRGRAKLIEICKKVKL